MRVARAIALSTGRWSGRDTVHPVLPVDSVAIVHGNGICSRWQAGGCSLTAVAHVALTPTSDNRLLADRCTSSGASAQRRF